jgi:phage terminase large subunit GpA-like protein
MREFAEQEIVIPTGTYAGLRYRCDRQPFTALWFDEVDSGRWRQFWVTGPTQSSKTLSCCIIVLLYILFELRETCVFGLPDISMAKDKWERDLRPVIARTRFAQFLPQEGGGSRGGIPDLIKFGNGAFLKFMGGGGGDKQRAHFNTRYLVITEVDGLDKAGEASEEADKVAQMVARTKGWDLSQVRIFGECTVTTEHGKIWSSYQGGSAAHIALKCPHCGEWVIPKGTDEDRKLLIGWQEAIDEIAAEENARFACWHCGKAWTEHERHEANQQALLVHKGQSIEGDRVIGDLPRTRSLGFRWTAVHNCLVSPKAVALNEYRHAKEADEGKKENQARELHQFDWCIPYAGTQLNLSAITREHVVKRVTGTPRGLVPAEFDYLTVAIDVHKWNCHWLALASKRDATSVVIDYGVFALATHELGEQRALWVGLHEFHDLTQHGWAAASGGLRSPDVVFVDSGYNTDWVYQFCMAAEINPKSPWRWYPTKGYGRGQERTGIYRPHTKINKQVRYVGEQYHISLYDQPSTYCVEMNADFWKSQVHDRLVSDPEEPGALALFSAMPGEHAAIASHFTAEVQKEEFVPGEGWVRWWHRERKSNHWFDCVYGALVAAHFCGARRIAAAVAKPRSQEATQQQLTTPDGRPFHVLAR